ncbi:MAG: hypothetical protein J7K02_07120 [Deltaproteobacteria bacterium]|nr:hypothetical protein [Deltaproteobacteria bacterium]
MKVKEIKAKSVLNKSKIFDYCLNRNFSISWGSSLKMLHLRSMGMSFFVSCPITDA